MNPGTSEMQFVSALDRVPAMRGVLCHKVADPSAPIEYPTFAEGFGRAQQGYGAAGRNLFGCSRPR